MTQDDKNLLMIDICARLPYGIKSRYYDGIHDPEDVRITKIDDDKVVFYINENKPSNYGYVSVEYIKPFLRPMSSMTEEEEIAYLNLEGAVNIIDWFNAHHFDYRGLIKKGLALESTDNMYLI